MAGIEEILVVGIMPFLYGAATRLPFIYFVIHLVGTFDIDMLWVGIYVTLYQGSRVITSAFSIVAPKTSHFLGTSIGLAGFLTVYLSDNSLLTPFVAGTAVVGFSETMSSMQKYAKEMFQNDPDREKASRKLRYQYASVMIGVVFAFSIGGFVYQYYFIDGVALFGVIIESLGLASLLVYLLIHKDEESRDQEQEQDKEDENENEDAAQDTPPSGPHRKNRKSRFTFLLEQDKEDENENENEDAAQDTPPSGPHRKNRKSRFTTFLGRRTMRMTTLTRTVKESNATYDTNENIAATWVNWIMCISFGVEALTIGYNLSIGPIFLLDEFNKETGIIGIMFAVGAASGTVAAVSVTCTEFGRNTLKKIASSPFDICFAMLGIGTGVLVAAIPVFGAHVTGVVLLMCFNDLGATLMTELQASISTTSNYAVVGPLGQVVRRTLNCITALTGPIFFGIFPRLPYFVAGGVTLIWTAVLFVAFKYRLNTILETIARETGHSRETVIARMETGALNFATTEVVHSTMKSSAAKKSSAPIEIEPPLQEITE